MQRFNQSVAPKALIIFLGLTLVAVGCNKKEPAQQPITLKVWKPFEDSQNFQPLIREYRKTHPNVQIEYTKKNIADYETDLLDALASGQGPDIFSINNAWLPRYLDKISPASEDASFNFRVYKETFVDTVVADFTQGGKIYGVALAVDSLGLFYNKDLLGSSGIATPPKTWDELVTATIRLSREDRTGFFTTSGVAMGLSANVNRASDILYLLMLQAGAVPWSADGRVPQFNQSISRNGNYINPGQQALQFYTSFADPQSSNYTWNYRSDYSIDAFANGRAAMLYTYSFNAQIIRQKAPNLNFDVAPPPQYDLASPAINFANYFGEVVNKQSANAAAAWEFLKFISGKEALEKYYAAHKQPSSRKDIIERQIQDPDIGVFAHANLTAKPFYRPDQAKMDTIFATMIDNVVLRGQRIDQALNEAQSQAATLSRRN